MNPYETTESNSTLWLRNIPRSLASDQPKIIQNA